MSHLRDLNYAPMGGEDPTMEQQLTRCIAGVIREIMDDYPTATLATVRAACTATIQSGQFWQIVEERRQLERHQYSTSRKLSDMLDNLHTNGARPVSGLADYQPPNPWRKPE